MAEIDEVELMRLRKQDQTVHALMGNPKAKKKIFEAYREANPNARIPELEMEEAAREPVMKLEQTVADLQKQIADDRAEREKQAKLSALTGNINSGKAKLRKDGWTDEGIGAVEKIMEERGILDIEVAAAFYEKQNPPQVPATPRGMGGWNFIEQVNDSEADLKKLLDTRGNNEVLADKMAREALNEFRGATRR
ncbi:MAG: hypothetical protein WC829_01225 [Hyphomicrobium sp.]|jgi:hypothetical protein